MPMVDVMRHTLLYVAAPDVRAADVNPTGLVGGTQSAEAACFDVHVTTDDPRGRFFNAAAEPCSYDIHKRAEYLPVSYTHLTLPTNREV